MTPLKWFLSILAILLLAGGVYYTSRSAHELKATSPQTVSATPAKTTSPLSQAFHAAPPLKRVQDLYESESKRIGAVDPDPALTQKRLAEAAADLNEQEMNWLKARALDRSESGDARFFATYLLALSSKDESIVPLKELALSTVPKEKNPGLMELEKQIRAQAIEGLGRKRGNAQARDALMDVIVKQTDPFLSDRGHRGLYEWETGKSPEQQDKEALSKLLYKGK